MSSPGRRYAVIFSWAGAMGFFGKMLLWDSWRCSKMFVSCGAFVLNEASPAGGNPCVEERKGSDVVLRKLLAVALLCCLFPLANAGADETAFRLTPEGAALLRERGSVGYLYWGTYRGC